MELDGLSDEGGITWNANQQGEEWYEEAVIQDWLEKFGSSPEDLTEMTLVANEPRLVSLYALPKSAKTRLQAQYEEDEENGEDLFIARLVLYLTKRKINGLEYEVEESPSTRKIGFGWDHMRRLLRTSYKDTDAPPYYNATYWSNGVVKEWPREVDIEIKKWVNKALGPWNGNGLLARFDRFCYQ